MKRFALVLLVVGLLGAGVGPALAAGPSPGPPYPDPIDGVRVYDFADVLADDTIASLEATIAGIEERTGAQIAVYTQVKPESDTPDEAERDAAALIDQWGIGQAGIDDGLAILFDLDLTRCHGQVQLYAGPGYRATYLDNEARKAIFDESMLPALRECDLDGALLAAMERIEVGMSVVPQESSEGVQLVEAPEAGIAVTVPGDWDVDIPMQVVPGGVLQVLKAIKAGSGGCWVGLHRTDDLIGLDDHTALREFTRGIMLAFRLDPRYEVSDETIDVMLPAGPALRVDMVEPFPEGDLHQASYSLAAPDGYIFLNCIGYSRPDDDWLSIAESFEFLPAE